MNRLKIDEPISIFVSKNETLTHKAFLYLETKSSKPKYYNLIDADTGYFTIDTITTTQPICTELIDFLNCNFDNYNACFIWFTKFFTSYIIYTGEDDINKFEINKLYSFSMVKELFEKYFEEIKNDSKRGQRLLSDFVDYIFNINNIEEIKDFTTKIRFYIYYNSHTKKLDRFINNYFSIPQGFSFRTISDIKVSTEKDLINFFKSAPNYDIEPNYSSSNDNIYGILYVTLFQFVLNNKYLIKKCKNCGKYFITDNPRINYCNNSFKGKQTCRDIGNQIAQRIKQENDIVYGKYRKIYAKKAMLVKRNPDIDVYKKDYENWKKEAKNFMDAIRNEKKTYEEFDKWLDKNK
jgi:hypothetical protein